MREVKLGRWWGIFAWAWMAWAAAWAEPDGYTFSLENPQRAGGPPWTVWVWEDRFRIEESSGAEKNVFLFNGQEGLSYIEGHAEATPIPATVAKAIAVWETALRRPGFGTSLVGTPGKGVIAGVPCRVQSLRLPGRDGAVQVTEWVGPDGRLVMKREVVGGPRPAALELHHCEALARVDPTLFELPKGVEIRRPWKPELGRPAQDFALTPYGGGRPGHLSDWKGKKAVVLNFTSIHCSPCRMEAPDFVRAYAALRGRGVEFVSVTNDTEQEVAEMVKRDHLPWLFVKDGGIGAAYGANPLPRNIVIDRQGVIRTIAGVMDEFRLVRELETVLEAP